MNEGHFLMEIYTEQEREEIMQTIISEMRNDERILSVILAGSTSRGFNDRFSDIDLVIVVDDENFRSCCKEWVEWFGNQYNEMMHFGGPLHEGKQVYCYLLEGYLEVDLVFESRSAISPRKERKFIFNRTATLLEELNNLSDRDGDVQKGQYLNSISNVWYNIIHGTVALKRGNIWRSYSEILQLMCKTADLAGMVYNVKTEDMQSIDLLPTEIIEDFSKCIASEISNTSIETALRRCMRLYFNLAKTLDIRFGIDIGIEAENLLGDYPDKVLG